MDDRTAIRIMIEGTIIGIVFITGLWVSWYVTGGSFVEQGFGAIIYISYVVCAVLGGIFAIALSPDA